MSAIQRYQIQQWQKKKKLALKVFFNGVFEFVTSWKVDDVHQLFVQQTLSVFYDAATGV